MLLDADLPFLVGGGLAFWARGGPKTEHDVHFLVKPEDAEQALQAFEDAGHRTARPPEQWLYKAWVNDVLVDLIFEPINQAVDDAMFERGEDTEVYALRLRVASLEDVVVSKLLAISEQDPDFSSVLEMVRSLREQIDWESVRRQIRPRIRVRSRRASSRSYEELLRVDHTPTTSDIPPSPPRRRTATRRSTSRRHARRAGRRRPPRRRAGSGTRRVGRAS